MPLRTDAADAAVGELGAVLFASLRRTDQRARGVAYLRGLLRAEGRKSIRGIAAAAGEAANEQRLHHFVSESTWDWMPVRRALAGHLAERRPPLAWVLRPLLIPRAGSHSVGVGRHFEARRGHTTTAQRAVGVWAADDESSYPVHWGLHLSAEWLADPDRRRRMSIPDGLRAESFGAAGVSALLEAAGWPESPDRPVVLDARYLDLAGAVRRLRAARVPFLARVAAHTPVRVTRPGHGADPVPAAAVLVAAQHRRRPVSWTGPDTVTTTRLAAAARVRLDAAADLLLLGTAELGGPWPGEVWLTDLAAARPADLVRLTGLVDRVERDRADIAERVGIRDFAGRSYGGWHRHITLASAAHGLVVSTAPVRRARHAG